MGKLLRRIGYWIGHRRHEKALAEELEFHRAMKQEDLESRGMPAADAAVHSRRALGNTLAAMENSREVWTWSWLDQLIRDTRIGARSLLRTPGFTVFSILILSIGIGASVSVFAYFNSIFFKTLQIPNVAGFVRIYATEDLRTPIGYSTYIQYRERNRSLAQIGISAPGGPPLPLRLTGPQTLPIDIIQPRIVSGGLFKALGAAMILGRAIEPEDENSGSPNVVVLNDEAWKRYFGRDAGVLDKTVYLNNTPYRIVGVAPRSLQDAFTLFSTRPTPQLFVPIRENAPPRGFVDVAGRLAAGVSRSQAQADFSRIAAQLSVEKKGVPASVTVERADLPPSWVIAELATAGALFLVVVFTILLIACDDIAIMLFARITARQREMGIRVALGGSRTQLVRQLVSENILISILGGTGAMIFILLTSRLIERLPVTLPDTSRAVFNWRVLVFTILTSLATTLFFGLRPALECVSRDVVASLTPGSKTASRRQGRVRSNLVMGQIAVCTALLITTAVVVRGMRDIVSVFSKDPGFKTEHIWVSDINFVGTAYDRESQFNFYRRLVPLLMAAPGMESVSIVNNSRGIDGTNDGIRTGVANVTLPVTTIPIDEEYFRTLQAPLVAGRAFNDRDTLNSAPVAIINQELAKLLVRTEKLENPIGRRITSGNGTSLEIVGIARNVAHRTGFRDVITVLYRPLSQTQRATVDTVTVMTRFSGTAGGVRRIMHEKVSELDSSLFVYNAMTLDDQQGRILLPLRIIEYLIGIPGIFALLLGIVGTYGTMATLVAQRRREVGIRIALGAHPSTAVRGILREGLRSVTIGAGFGIVAVVIIVLWLSRNIGEVEFYDPIAFVAMTLLVITIAGAACYIPAKRASRLDPMIVLRED